MIEVLLIITISVLILFLKKIPN